MSIAAIYLGWAVATWAMFWRCRPAIAVLGSFLGGWILLPVGSYPAGAADAVFPYWIIGLALPSDMLLTKAVAAPMAAFVGVVIFDRQALARLRPIWLDLPIVLWCLWPAVAAAFAAEPRPAPLLAIGYLAAAWGLPWLLGRLYFASAEGRLLLVKGLVWSALACLPFSVIEGALGPVVYDAVYETHPFRADGAVRYVGFRPIGFFEHGNQFGLWISLSALAALWLAISSRVAHWRWAAAMLVAMALAAQSIGAIALLALGAAGLWVFAHVRPRLLASGAAVLIAIGGTVYLSGAIPFQAIAKDTGWGREIVNSIRGAGRGSFTWRIAQDQKLLADAVARPVTGSAQWDWWRAKETRPWSLSLLIVGQFGLVGLLLTLATLLGPALRTAWVAPRGGAWRPEGLPLLLASIAVLTVIDALLNSFVFFPAIVAAGGLAAGAAREER
jgi:hypothetical protein